MYALKARPPGSKPGAEPDAVLAKLIEGAVARGTFTGTYERGG